MTINSPAFNNNQDIPFQYTCDGENVSPPLEFKEVPQEAKSLVLIVDDPDAPAGVWVHWLVFNINPATTLVPENTIPQGGIGGINSFNQHNYSGPCPPSGTHRYFFKLYALDKEIKADASLNKEDIEVMIKDSIIEKAELIGLYQKK